MGDRLAARRARRALIGVATALVIGADALAIAAGGGSTAPGVGPSQMRSEPRDTVVVEATPRAVVRPVQYAWVRPAVVNVWEKPSSPRRIDRMTMSARPAMRLWAQRLTVAARLDLNGRLMTQALHGDRVAVVSSARGWSLVRVEAQTGGVFRQGILGFVPTVQLSSSRLSGPKAGRRSAATAIAVARRHLGVSYLWAGMSRYGIDCSGLTYVAFRAAGVILPRDAADQARIGLAVGSRHLRPGDLVFFGRGARTSIHHVGIYLGRGLVLHAPHTGSTVRITPLSAWSDFWGARRVIR